MRKYLALIFTAVFFACVCTGCGQEEEQQIVLLDPVGVAPDTATARLGTVSEYKTYSGQVIPYVEEVCFSVSGRIKEVKAGIGEQVEQGQVLAVLEDEEIRKQVKSLKDEIENMTVLGEYDDRIAQANIDIAVIQWKNAAGYGNSSLIEAKRIEISRMESDLKQTRELRELELSYLKQKLAKAEQELRGLELKAPVSGEVVYAGTMKIGDSVNEYTTVFCIADNTRTAVVSNRIPDYELKNAARVYARIADADYDLTPVTDEDRKFSPGEGSENTSYSAFVTSAEQTDPESGMYAAVVLVSVYEENVLTIPSNALYREGKLCYVYKMTDGERERVQVSVGAVTDTRVQITEGLKEGDEVYVKE